VTTALRYRTLIEPGRFSKRNRRVGSGNKSRRVYVEWVKRSLDVAGQ